MEIECSKCKVIKDSSCFFKGHNKKTGFAYECKDCRNQYLREIYYKTNKEKISKLNVSWQNENKNKVVARKRGVSLKEIEELKNKANNKCEICEDTINLCVDHNHQTGELRGLLCGRCNKGLGLFRDNKNLLKQAIIYLSTK